MEEKRLTQLLQAWGGGDEEALEQLAPLVHDELHRLARGYMRRERPGHILQTTALINEAYVRLIDYKRVDWHNRNQFYAISAQLMRHILVDFARSSKSLKRGGAFQRVSLADEILGDNDSDPDLVALDDALNALAEVDERKSAIVELRFFGGLGVKESADVLGVSNKTVMRDWKVAKVWLLREIEKQRGRPRL